MAPRSYDVVHPICCTQKIAVYETKTRFYLVGSNNSQTRFRILKIDRTEPLEINVLDDKVEYNQLEIQDLLKRLECGNRGPIHRGSAFGILGLIRFLEGYYLILISKRRRVAVIGGHTIYKIDDTDIIPIALENNKAKIGNPDEAKYLRMFQNVDLSSNFYFSYSYDLTRTLQYNLAPSYGIPAKYCGHPRSKPEVETPEEHEETFEEEPIVEEDMTDNVTEDAKDIDMVKIFQFHQMTDVDQDVELAAFPNIGTPPFLQSPKHFRSNTKVFRGEPTEKFVWNSYILEGLKNRVHPDWLLNITHGFVGQSNINVFGKPLYVTLIARRSNKFAGTRFLKRGTNDEGFVANDVETEQICHDAATISVRSGRYTSYVQMRGSAPFFWSQETIPGRITPKPQILVDRADPFFTTTAVHFNSLMSRYGAPIIVLNLVKIKEKKPHEQILSGLLKESLDYLNEFLPPQHRMQYLPWDMARVTKSKEDKVIEILAEIAEKVMKETGFFHSGPQIYCNQLRSHPSFIGMRGFGYNDQHAGLKQTGILRVNCVDCLDRTNTAQFMVGKCALGFQLYALGVIESPVLQFDSDAVRILEELFEAHGDTLALQYGGSQMVHRIRTYRKIAPWTSYSRDIMQTVSRYYSNAFTDMDKQQAINLFLGLFKPHAKGPNIWDIPTDYYLHHNTTMNIDAFSTRQSYSKWFHQHVLAHLPFAWDEVAKKRVLEKEIVGESDDEERIDLFMEYYRPSELTEFDSLYQKVMPTSTKDFMPTSSTDPSPFVVRGRTQDDSPQMSHRHKVSGQPELEESSGDEASSSDDDKSGVMSPQKIATRDNLAQTEDNWTFSTLYGIKDEPRLSDKDIKLYQRYADINRISKKTGNKQDCRMMWEAMSNFSWNASNWEIDPPTVDQVSIDIYENYCNIGKYGPSEPSTKDQAKYNEYIRQNYF